MTRLIITNDLAGAGYLKKLERDALVVCLERRFIFGPILIYDNTEIDSAPECIRGHGLTLKSSDTLRSIVLEDVSIAMELANEFDDIELCFDPTPNGQLSLAWFLDRLIRYPKLIHCTTIMQSSKRLGSLDPFEIDNFSRKKDILRYEHLEDAARIWSAWTSSTPHQTFALLDDLHGSLPYARSCVLSLLDELPSSESGLGAAEFSLIKLLRDKEQRLDSLISNYLGGAPLHAFEIQEIIPTIKYLCICPVPVIEINLGDIKPQEFDLDLNSIGRYAAWKLTLSSLGHEILDKTTNFISYNPLRRWWGNTQLYGNDVWRWNPREKDLLPPGQ